MVQRGFAGPQKDFLGRDCGFALGGVFAARPFGPAAPFRARLRRVFTKISAHAPAIFREAADKKFLLKPLARGKITFLPKRTQIVANLRLFQEKGSRGKVPAMYLSLPSFRA